MPLQVILVFKRALELSRTNISLTSLAAARHVYSSFFKSTHCFVARRWVGDAEISAAGDIENVSHLLHPDGQFAVPNSPYALKFRSPACCRPGGRRTDERTSER